MNIIFKIKWKLYTPSRSDLPPFAILLQLSQTGDMRGYPVAELVNVHQDLLFHALRQIVQCSCQKKIQNAGMFIHSSQVTFDDVPFLHKILFVNQQVINILCHQLNVVYFMNCAEDADTTYSHFSVTADCAVCFD